MKRGPKDSSMGRPPSLPLPIFRAMPESKRDFPKDGFPKLFCTFRQCNDDEDVEESLWGQFSPAECNPVRPTWIPLDGRMNILIKSFSFHEIQIRYVEKRSVLMKK